MSVDTADRTSAPDHITDMTIHIHVGRFVRIVASCGLVVFGLGAFRQVVVAVLNVDTDAFGWNLINLDQEGNLPAWFTSILLFTIGMTAFLLAQLGRTTEPRNGRAWVLLGVFFVLFSADEIVRLHEMTMGPMRNLGTWTGPFHFAWVVWALPAVALVGAGFVPFVLRVRRATAIRLLVAGAVYVSGGLGMEMIGGMVAEARGRGDYYAICFTIEEGGEMLGALLFLRALLFHIADSTAKLAVAVRR